MSEPTTPSSVPPRKSQLDTIRRDLEGAPPEIENLPERARAPRPRRLARLVLEVEADNPEELVRSTTRALSRLRVGCPEWEEETDLTNGTYHLDLVERAKAGRRHVQALELWRAEQAAPKTQKPK